jgi:hypothetical protein
MRPGTLFLWLLLIVPDFRNYPPAATVPETTLLLYQPRLPLAAGVFFETCVGQVMEKQYIFMYHLTAQDIVND